MRIIITGSRTFDDYALLNLVMDKWRQSHVQPSEDLGIVVLSGGAKGVDKLGE